LTNQELIQEHDKYIMGTYGRFPVALSHGLGALLYDFDGKEYVDFASGIGVNSIGHGNPVWVKAIADQAMRLGHASNLYYTEPAMRVAKTLCERTGFDQAFFANSGAESNEGLFKLARKYSRDKYGGGRDKIVTLLQSFHGRTITGLSATGQDAFQQHFFPFTAGFAHVKAGDMDALVAEAGNGDTAAVLLELVQGEGGVLPLDRDYVAQVAAFCEERDILLLLDEVQTGIGRTGSLFAFQQYGIRPDAVSFAKGIAGGLPFGGFLAGEKCSKVLGPGQHATTFGGNPIAAAAALVVLTILTEAELLEVGKKGQYIQEKVRAMNSPYVAEVRGMGLMIGVVIQGMAHKELARTLNAAGLLALTAGSDTLRFLPPLTLTYEEIDRGLKVLAPVLAP